METSSNLNTPIKERIRQQRNEFLSNVSPHYNQINRDFNQTNVDCLISSQRKVFNSDLTYK